MRATITLSIFKTGQGMGKDESNHSSLNFEKCGGGIGAMAAHKSINFSKGLCLNISKHFFKYSYRSSARIWGCIKIGKGTFRE